MDEKNLNMTGYEFENYISTLLKKWDLKYYHYFKNHVEVIDNKYFNENGSSNRDGIQ